MLNKKTKIVATIGPASQEKKVLKKMVMAGMNLARLNFSHGNYDNHRLLIRNIRQIEKDTQTKIGIIGDIQGPRIRVAGDQAPLKIEKDEKIIVTDEKGGKSFGSEKVLALDWPEFYCYLKPGKIIFIEDGLIQLEAVRRMKFGVEAKVLAGGEIKPRKGVNIPSISNRMGFLTEKDLADLEFILTQEVDFIAVSFVSDRKDLQNLKEIIKHLKEKISDQKKAILVGKKNIKNKDEEYPLPWILPKIERTEAIENIDEIIEEANGILVARGDLAIEEPQEKVVLYQKDIIAKCITKNKPVIVATQMLSSMTQSARPTRAEISDVTNAVIDNTDAVMLSNESAVGKFPVETVETMSKIILSTEESPYNDVPLKKASRFGKILAGLFSEGAEEKRRGRKKIVWATSLEELAGFSALRQEDVKLKLKFDNIFDKRKASIFWGAEG